MLRGNGKICGDDGCGVGAGLQNGPICNKAAGRRRAPSPTMVCRKKYVGVGITRPHRSRIIVVMLINKHRRRKNLRWGGIAAAWHMMANGMRRTGCGICIGPSRTPVPTPPIENSRRGRFPHRPAWRTPTGQMRTSSPTILYRKKFVGAIHESPARFSSDNCCYVNSQG